MIDLRRVTGVDASAVVVVRQGDAPGRGERVRGRASRGRRIRCAGSSSVAGWWRPTAVVRFEPDLDRGLQRCEDVLLGDGRATAAGSIDAGERLDGPPGLSAYLERVLGAGGHRADPPGRAAGRRVRARVGAAGVETVTPEGERVAPAHACARASWSARSRSTRGSRARPTWWPRTPSVVLRFSRASIARMEAEEPELAAALHRWLASTLAERLTDTQRVAGHLLD